MATQRKRPVKKNVDAQPVIRAEKSREGMTSFKKIQEAKTLYDPNKLPKVVSSTFSKEQLREYMENPTRYVKQLRNLSRFLVLRSQIYRRIINLNASMIDTNYRSVIPNVDLNKSNNKNKIIKSYSDTLKVLDKMNLSSEMFKVYLKCWVEDVFYGVYYFSKDEGGIVIPLDPDYCQITGIYMTGDFSFDFDCSYFRSRQEELERWGEPFTSMYRAYESDTINGKWQPVPDEYCICMKVNLEDYLTPLPPYMTLFNSIIDLEDLKEISAVADEQQIYKLLAFTMPLIGNSTTPDNFAVDPDTCIEYYDKIVDDLPDYAASVLIPGMTLETVKFDDDSASNVNKVENSSRNILKTSGHSMMAGQEGTTAVMAALKADEEYALSSLLPQTQAWINRFLSYQVSNPCKVKMLEVTKYTKEAYKDSLIKDMNYGLPVITTLGVLNGYSESELVGMATINDYMGLNELFKPYETASTRSKNDSENPGGGAPKKDIPTDESELSDEKREKSNG